VKDPKAIESFSPVLADWRSGVSAERRDLKISGNICGGLPTRRYEEVESSAVPLKIGATGFAGCSSAKPAP